MAAVLLDERAFEKRLASAAGTPEQTEYAVRGRVTRLIHERGESLVKPAAVRYEFKATQIRVRVEYDRRLSVLPGWTLTLHFVHDVAMPNLY